MDDLRQNDNFIDKLVYLSLLHYFGFFYGYHTLIL